MPWYFKKGGASKGYWKKGAGWQKGASWSKGGVVKRSLGAAKSYKSGVKNQYFNCSVNGYCTFNFEKDSATSDVQIFLPYIGNLAMTGTGNAAKYTINDSYMYHGAAVNDRAFRLMCAQYDEVKLVSMSVKLMPSQTVTAEWVIKVASTIDRNFSHDELNNQNASSMTDSEPQTATTILNNPGVVIQNYNANKIYPMTRHCYVKDLKEKSDFVDATVQYDTISGHTPLQNLKLESWIDECTTFSPCFFYCLQANMAPTTSASISMNYTVEYNFVFRNPKNGIDRFIIKEQTGYVNPSSAKSSEVRTVAKSSTEDESTEDEPAATAAAAATVTTLDASVLPIAKLK